MALNIKSLYSNNSSGTSSTAKKGGLNVQSLRDREFELKVNENKSIGNISYGAKQAIESNNLDSYTPKNDAEKSVLDAYKKWTGYGRTYETVKAQYDKNKFGKGNIDLTNRPIFKNSNGAISTVDSIGITEDGKEIVIPTIIRDKNGNAKRLTDDEAIKHYHETGEHLGKFNTRDEADEYAQTLHIDQDLYYSALPEMTAEEEQTLSKYGFNPTSFSNDDFKVWAEAHNFEYRMAGNDLTGTEYKWLPKAASKWNPWKTLTTDEEEQDKKVLERFIEKKNLKANATNHPVFTSAVTVVTAPYRGLAGAVATVKDGVSAIVGKNVNTYDTAHEIVDDANIIRETVTDEHASKWFDGASGKLGNYGALTYNGIMSIGDMVMTSLATKGIGLGLGLTGKSLAAFTSNATSALLGSNSASSTIIEKKKEGYSDGKAVLVGVSTGLAEYITEKYSLEAIFKAPASVMKQGIRSFIAEGSEEMASDVLSKIADRVIAGNDSTIKKSIENYMQNGMSKNDAIKQATQDSIYETLSAGLVGGFSGVAVSSAYHGFGRSEIKKTGADMRSVAADVIESGLDGPKNSNAYKYAEKLSKKGVDKITDYELGLQHIYNIEQIEYEQKKEEKATKKAEKAARKAQSSVSETADNAEQAPTNFPYNVYAEPQISVGNVFKDTKTGNTITVVERDAENTTVEIDTGAKTETREFTNSQADSLATNEQFEQMEGSESAETAIGADTVEKIIAGMTAEEKERHIGWIELKLSNGETNIDTEELAVYKALIAERKNAPKNITLTRKGDFYEAYGDEAVELANKLNLALTPKTINGEKVQMVGFPVSSFDRYKNILGNNYNISVSDTPSVTSINEQNMPVSTENTPVNEAVTNIDVDMAEGEILSLKHTKNVYSLFKGALRIVVGKDIITDGFVVLPLTDESLAGVKRVVGDSAPIQENPNFTMSKFYHADNDVIIQGNPKVGEATAGNKTVKAYTFKIADAFYSCQQKFIDAFNNGKNVIKANKSNNIPWTVHNENGELVALFLASNHAMDDEHFNSLQSVAEIKNADRQKKAENANKPFNQNEVRQIFDAGRPFFSTVHGVNYVGEGHIFVVCDESAAEFIKNKYRKQNANSNYEIEHKDGFGGMVEKMLSEAKELAEAKDPISYSGTSPNNRTDNAYIMGDYAIVFNKNYTNIIKKRSKDMKIISNGSMSGTILVGYDVDGNITGFALPILAKGNITTKDGKSVPFVRETDIKRLVKEAAANETKSDKSVAETPESVTEPTEGVIKKADSVTKTPKTVTETPESIENTSDAVSDETIEIETKMFNDIVDEVENDDTVRGKKGKHYYVSKHTPEIIVKKADIEDLPMIISFETLYLAVRESGELIGHYHGLGASNIKKLYKVLSDPTYILKNNENGRINIISDIAIGKNSKSVISIELDVYKNVEGVKETNNKGNYNLVITLFSAKDNYVENLKNKQEMSVPYEKKEDTHSSDLTSENMMLGNTEKVSSDTIIAEETENVNTSEKTITPTLTDKCELHETTHTKTGKVLWVISLNDKIASDEYKALSAAVKKVGGYYSRFAKTPDGKAIPGFIFKTEPGADVFKVFNDFFESGVEPKPVAGETTTTAEIQQEEPTAAEEKPDVSVGDVIEYNGKQWLVKETGFNMRFENIDKSDKESAFSHIGGMESFKNTCDYKVVAKNTSSEVPAKTEKNAVEKSTKNEEVLKNKPESDIISVKEDFKVGDILEFDGEQWKCVNIDSTMIDFVNVDKNAFQPELSVILPYELFKEKTDYTVIKESAENVESQSEVLDRESGVDGGRLHTGVNGTSEQETTEEDDGQHRKNSRETLSESTDTDGNRPDVRNDSERVYGRNDAEDAVSEASRNGTELTEEAPETIDTVDKSVEKKRPSNKNNFIITDDIAADFDNTRPSAEDNIAAIELLLTLENEGRPATAEEKKILAKYKGWGGIDTRNVSWALRQKMLNLFNGEQLRNMQTSTTSAFFTPTGVIDAMYNGLKRMGFKGGNVLESSMGVGNFFGRMPPAMSAKSALTGVELESYTARIAQYLYPGATVINKPFQDVAIKNGSFDMVIGNVPFGNEKIRYGKKSYALHNYFIISSLDKVRDGGVVAVITSAGTLDSYGMDARQAIMDRADVVACYKLPAGVFSRNASTDVQTDLLILRKRADGAKPVGDSILNVTTTADGLRLNEYFVKNPQNILGTLAKGTNAWGEITTVLDDGSFYDKLNKAMGKLPKGLISGNIDLKPIETIVATSSKPRFFEKDGKIYADDGAGTATAIANGTKSQIVRDYMAVRDAYKELLAAYSNGETVKNADGTYSIREVSDADIKSLRKSLSKAYENFAKKHGAITGDGKKKLSFKTNINRDNTFLEADADYYLVSGLEKYNTKAKQIEKSELFEKDTLKKKRITSVDTASDALIVSLNESGKVDFARMQELTGKTEKQLAEELKGEIVFTPDGDYVLTDVYLSGNIYEKLEKVKGKPEFKEQQEMLERVIPTPKDASSINIKLGANYIDTEYIEQFSREVFHERISVSKNSAGTWTVDGSGRSRYGDILNVKYGCEKFNAIQLLEKILNDSEITATDTLKQNGTSVTVYNPKMTEVARQKAEDIKSAFENWIFRDSERRTAIVDKYNRMYNNYRPLDFAHIAEKLSFESMDEDLRAKLYPHQKKGIARALFGGNVLFAHGVGTGKTFEMIASVMEAKRMGIVNKTAMVVPNNKVVDFKNDIAQAYPNAKVLVIDTANKKRQTMLGLVNSNDWDIVLVGKNTFTKIPVGAELQANYINEQVEELDKQITEAQFDRNTSKREMNRLTKLRDGLLRKLETVNSETKRDENGIEFEKLGFDCICVDEAHNYKSIITPSRLNIKGLSKNGSSQQANDMLMKLDYMRSIDGKIIFGTGTPITNTVSEIYNMMRMVRPDILEDAGIHSLDEWVNTFANIETQTEVGIDGRIKDKSTQIIKSFFNATEMIGMYRQFADVVFTDDVVKDLPGIEFIPVEIEGTEVHRAVQQAISKAIATAKRSEALSVYGKVMTMGSAAALDTRMLAGADSEYNPFKDYSVEELEYENSKVNVMCNYVLDNYKSFADIKGTQLIFCDGGAGTGDVYSFNVHKDIRQKLIKLGIPENEIVIMKNQNDAQLEELYAKVNSGEVRVLIGTSAKMAEGLNVQERVVAIHYPTVTYNPADLEQSMARGRRKGNINKKVKIYRYLQGNTFDSYKWQALERKGEMINRALRGEAVDELEDVTSDIDPATAMAITSGNPLVKEKIDIDKEVKRLKVLKQNYMNEHYRYEDTVAKNPGQIRQLTEYAQRIEQDIALRDKHSNKAEISVKGKSFEKQTDANKALIDAVKTAPKNGQYTKLGTYNGFDIMFKGDTGGMGYSVILKGSNEYSVDYAGSGNNMARFAGVLNRLDAELKRVRDRLETLKADLDFAKEEVKKPFEKEKELAEALEKQKDVTYRYEHYSDKPAANAETSDTDNAETVQSSRDLVSADSTERWTTERVDGNEDKGVNLADIVRSISKKFDIPIATGKVTDSEASGIYKRKAETIRTRIANNLPTISHELGHHLDKDYNFSTMESVELLKSSLPAEFLERYKEADRGREAVAEFIRVYLKNTNDANRLCPDFYSDFISTLSKEDLKSLNEIAASVNEYLSYNISERYDAAITTSKDYAKSKRSVKDTAELIKQKWVDPYLYIKNAVDYVEEIKGGSVSGKNNAYKLATNALNSHSVTNFLLTGGMRDLSGNIVAGEKSFIECIADVNSDDMKLLDKYLVLRHSLEWIAPEQEDVTIKRVFADDTLEDVEEIKKQIAEIEDTHPEIKTAAENLYEYQNNILKYFVIPAGGMTEDTLTTLNRMYPSYVPFYRAKGKDKLLQGKAKSTFVNQQSPIKRAKGSGEMIISPLESILTNTEKMVNFSLRNQVGATLANYADTVDGFGQFMEAVPPDMIPHPVNISKIKDTFTDALQQVVSTSKDYFAVSDLFEELFSDVVTEYTPVANAGKKIVTVMKDGAKSYYQIHDDGLYRSVAELAPKQLEGFELVDLIMNFMKLTITQNNPIFAGTNAIRDFGTAYKLSEIDNPVSFTKAYVEAAYEIITKSENYKQYKAMGGGHSSELSANIEDISKTLRKVAQKDMGKARRLAYSIFRHPIETVAALNDAVESVPRFLEFQRTLKSGGDLEEAIYNANDLTTNFRRQGAGATAKVFNKFFLFNNAAIQGLDKTGRALTNKNAQRRNKTWLKFALVALIGGLIRYFWNKEVDEEGYENLSSYKKNNFYNYAIGDGMFISLPKERENAILDSLVERVLEKVSGNDEAFYDFGGYLSSQLLPPMIPDNFSSDSEHSSIENAFHSWIGSTAFGGLADIGFNQDFKGTPIESKYDEYLPSNERYNENTSKLAYGLGQTKFARDNNLSPKKIDHLVSSYTGILGQVNKALFPINDSRRDASIGLRNKFISDSNYSTDVLNRMYENQEKAEKAFNYSGSVSDAIEYEKNSVITSYISGMNKAVKALPEEEQRNGRAYLLKNLNSWNYEDTASQSNMLSSLADSTVSKDCIFSELPSSTLEWTVDKQKYVYQMTPEEYHKYISDYLTVIENARRHYGGDSVESYEAAKDAVKDYMSDYKKNVLKEQYLSKATAKTE